MIPPNSIARQEPALQNIIPNPSYKRFVGQGMVEAVLFLTICSIGLSLLGRYHWFFELFTHFVVQYLIALAIGLGIMVYLKYWKTCLLIFLLIGYLLVLILPLYIPRSQSSEPGGKIAVDSIHLISFNVHSSNQKHAEVLEFLRSSKADLIVLLEVTGSWVQKLTQLQPIYPYIKSIPRSDNFGMMILSRLPCDFSVLTMGSGAIPIISAYVKPLGITVIGIHPLPPMGTEYAEERNTMLFNMQNMIANAPGNERIILCGDMNCTSWSPYFQDFLKYSRLYDSREGFGILPSWPNSIPFLWIPIDHILVGSHLKVLERAVVSNSYGSDHYPVWAKIEFPMLAESINTKAE